MRIGVFDSGLGGLTVLKELIKKVPSAEYFYLGDTARTPYGSKAPETISRYALECANFLMSHEIELLVVACNTASSVALPTLIDALPCPVIGTIEPAISAVLALPSVNKIGLIGTQATISSGQSEEEIIRKAPGVPVLSQACPLFVPLVEEGLFEGEIVDGVIRHYLHDFRSQEVDSLILGCTHYPLISRSLQKFFGSDVRLIECSKAVADTVADKLPLRDHSRPGSNSIRYFVTDGAGRFSALAGTLLGDGGITAQKVSL